MQSGEIFLEVISLDCFETCWRRTMYIHACISFIRLYYKYLHFFYKSGYITYIYCLDIFLSQSAEYCQLLDIFLSLSLEYEIKREVSRRLSLQGEYVRLWYFLSHLLFVTNCLDLVKMIKSMYYHLIDFVVFKKCYHIFLINFLRTSLQKW